MVYRLSCCKVRVKSYNRDSGALWQMRHSLGIPKYFTRLAFTEDLAGTHCIFKKTLLSCILGQLSIRRQWHKWYRRNQASITVEANHKQNKWQWNLTTYMCVLNKRTFHLPMGISTILKLWFNCGKIKM